MKSFPRLLVALLLALGLQRSALPASSAAAPGAFSLLTPVDGAPNVSLLPTLTWSASSGAASYTLEAASDSGFTNIVLSQVGILTTSYTPGAPIAQGVTVYWRVTAVSGVDTTLATGAPFSFTTVILPPAAFTLTSPANTATGVALQPNFTWAASTGADTYTLEVATDSGFSSIVVSQTGLVATNYMPGSPLTGGTNYFWRVKAINGGGTTTSTAAPFSFQTLTTGPGGFSLLVPDDGWLGVSRNPYFLWDDAAGATSYTLELASDPAFSSLVCEVSGIPGSSFGSTLDLDPSTTYYWRVTAVNGTGTTMATGAPFSFTTTGSSGSGGSVDNGFSGSSGTSCGLLGLELIVPAALWTLRRRVRRS